MTILNQEDSILLVIDIQERLLKAVYNRESVLKKSEILAKTAAALDLPVFITEQYPKGLGHTITTLSEALDKAVYFEKTDFNALTDESLLSELKMTDRKQVVLCGIETHICVHQTAAALIENGFEVFVLKDSCGSRFEEEHLMGLSRMKDNGAFITTAEIALFELLKSAKHPNFKELQTLIK